MHKEKEKNTCKQQRSLFAEAVPMVLDSSLPASTRVVPRLPALREPEAREVELWLLALREPEAREVERWRADLSDLRAGWLVCRSGRSHGPLALN
jgi:hypothetical protein